MGYVLSPVPATFIDSGRIEAGELDTALVTNGSLSSMNEYPHLCIDRPMRIGRKRVFWWGVPLGTSNSSIFIISAAPTTIPVTTGATAAELRRITAAAIPILAIDPLTATVAGTTIAAAAPTALMTGAGMEGMTATTGATGRGAGSMTMTTTTTTEWGGAEETGRGLPPLSGPLPSRTVAQPTSSIRARVSSMTGPPTSSTTPRPNCTLATRPRPTLASVLVNLRRSRRWKESGMTVALGSRLVPADQRVQCLLLVGRTRWSRETKSCSRR